MKKIITVLLVGLLSLAGTANAAFPDKPVKIILQLPVGSGPDVVSRKIAEQLSIKWEQPVIIENKPGGNGIVALEAYKKEPADGYALLVAGVGEMITYPILSKNKKNVDNMEILFPMLHSEMMLITSPNNKTLTDVKEAFKKNPVFGSWGIASPPHIDGLQLSNYFNTNSTHAPYKDYGQWFIDVSSGQIAWSLATMASTSKLEKAGKLQYIAITGNKRDPDYPDIPTIKELTKKDIAQLKPWVAFYVNKSAPPAVQKQLVNDITEAANSKPVVDLLITMTYKPWKPTHQETLDFFAKQKSLYQTLVEQHKISID
jgi:tripartite-type tricarboxylate transporter receptor subunit TctC